MTNEKEKYTVDVVFEDGHVEEWEQDATDAKFVYQAPKYSKVSTPELKESWTINMKFEKE